MKTEQQLFIEMRLMVKKQFGEDCDVAADEYGSLRPRQFGFWLHCDHSLTV